MTVRMSPAPAVRFTNQYSKFKFDDQNRVLRDATTGKIKVRKELVQSMVEDGYRIEEPIKAYINDDGTMTIIDGHNRLVAAQSLGLPVAYIGFVRPSDPWRPIDSAGTIKPWDLRQFVVAYAQEGREDYAELLHYSDKTGIGLKQVCSMHYGESAGSGNAMKYAKAGTFKIKDRIHADIVADLVATSKMFIDWAASSLFVSALSACLFAEGFSSVHLKTKITKHPELLQKQKDLDSTIVMLDTIYNRNARNRYELAVEVRKVMRKRQNLRKG
jgi:hypothetical protein